MRPRLLLAAGVLAALTGISLLLVDRPVAHFFAAHGLSWRPFWNGGTRVFEVVTGFDVHKYLAGAVLLAAAAVTFLLKRRRLAHGFLFVGVTHFLARVPASYSKFVFDRLRPSQWLEMGGHGPTFFQPGGISFPSGHVAHFLGMALPFAVFSRRWGTPVLLAPLFIGVARVATNQHFLADTLSAAAWTVLVTALLARVMKIPATREGPTGVSGSEMRRSA